MVMTPDGVVVGGFVGGKAGLEEVRIPLDEALANAAALKEAETLEEDAQVKALHAVYQKLPADIRETSTLRQRLAELDVSNLTGIQDDIKAQAQMEEVMAALRAAGNDGKEMLRVVENALANACACNLCPLLQMKVGLQLMVAETVEDILAAKATLLRMVEVDSEHAEAIRAMAEQRFADPAKLLELIKKRRNKR